MFWAPICSGMKILLGMALSSVLNKSKSAITSLFNIKKKLWPLFMDGVQLSQGYSHFEEAVYFLPFSSQKFLVLILSTSEGWKAESTLEPPSGFEHGTPPEVLSSATNETKFFAENFSKNSNLDNSGISLPVFPSRSNLKLHNISVNPKMVKKVITNLICQRHLLLIVFQWWF